MAGNFLFVEVIGGQKLYGIQRQIHARHRIKKSKN
jgi:hypothetical protein